MKYRDLMIWKGYLEFAGLIEPEANTLRIWIHRCKVSETVEPINPSGNVVFLGKSIEVDWELPLLQIDFASYIAYSVINESFTVWDEYEKFEGNQFRIYTKSRYLDFVSAGTIATEEYPGPFVHYGIMCLNHIIDVVSVDEPIISEVKEIPWI